MRSFSSIIAESVRDIKKRAAKEYADGGITEKSFNDVMRACTTLENVGKTSKEKVKGVLTNES